MSGKNLLRHGNDLAIEPCYKETVIPGESSVDIVLPLTSAVEFVGDFSQYYIYMLGEGSLSDVKVLRVGGSFQKKDDGFVYAYSVLGTATWTSIDSPNKRTIDLFATYSSGWMSEIDNRAALNLSFTQGTTDGRSRKIVTGVSAFPTLETVPGEDETVWEPIDDDDNY